MTGTPAPPGRRSWLLAALALALVLAGVGWWWASGRDVEAPPQAGVSATPTAAASGPAPTSSPADAAAEPGADEGTAATSPPTGAAGPPAVEDPSGLEPVPPREVPELPPVPFTEPADFGNEVSARVAQVSAVQGEGAGPGERSGPALHVTVEIRNDSPAPVTLDYVVVNLADAAGRPGSPLNGDPRSAPFAGVLEPGSSRAADYVLRLPDGPADPVTVTLSYGAQAPTAVFTGPVPTG